MAIKVKCLICGAEVDNRGMRLHNLALHSAPKGSVSEGTVSGEHSTENESQTAQLAELTAQLERKDSEITQLLEEVSTKQAENDAFKAQFSELDARLAEVPQSIGDYSSDEKAVFFWKWLGDLDDEQKAHLAEIIGSLTPLPSTETPAPAEAPLAEDVAVEEAVKTEEPKGIRITLGGKTVGYVKG